MTKEETKEENEELTKEIEKVIDKMNIKMILYLTDICLLLTIVTIIVLAWLRLL